ncbi:MAG: hypothetical protein ACKESB_01270 [Candidatus Hodgkinia cicadicola]
MGRDKVGVSGRGRKGRECGGEVVRWEGGEKEEKRGRCDGGREDEGG